MDRRRHRARSSHPERGPDELRRPAGRMARSRPVLEHEPAPPRTHGRHRLSAQAAARVDHPHRPAGAICDVYDAITGEPALISAAGPGRVHRRMAWPKATSTRACSSARQESWASTRWAAGDGWSRAGWRWWWSRRAVLTMPAVKVTIRRRGNMPVSVQRIELARGKRPHRRARERGAVGLQEPDALWADQARAARRLTSAPGGAARRPSR